MYYFFKIGQMCFSGIGIANNELLLEVVSFVIYCEGYFCADLEKNDLQSPKECLNNYLYDCRAHVQTMV